MNTRKSKPSIVLRWLTALVMIPVILLFLWFGGWASFAATLLVVVLGILEFHTMLVQAGYRPLLLISLGLGILFLVSAMLPGQRLLLLEVGVSASLVISLIWLLFRKNQGGGLIDWALTLASPLYMGWPMSLLLLLRGDQSGVLFPTPGVWFTLPSGGWWLLTALLACWAFDSAAFFTGRYLGRHKLAPHISPAKTWEGVIGGSVLCVITCLMTTIVPLHVPWYLAVVLGLLISFASTLGDLAESMIKRQTNAKDSGQIMPGHGGMLDRTDSILFTVVVVYFFSQVFQLLS